MFLALILLYKALGMICDEVCIALCDPNAPDGCGSYCCPEYSILVTTENCPCLLICNYNPENNYECENTCNCQNLRHEEQSTSSINFTLFGLLFIGIMAISMLFFFRKFYNKQLFEESVKIDYASIPIN